jgi:hypothetical protein
VNSNAFWFVRQPDVSEEHTVSPSGSKLRCSSPPASPGCLFGLVFGPEDGGGIFLQNIALSPKYIGLQSKGP